MAPIKRSNPLQLSAGQAEYVLNCLLTDRQITRWQVQGALSKMHREIRELEQRLAALRAGENGNAKRGAGKHAMNGEANASGPAAKSGRRRKRRTITPEAHASHVLQGQYIFFMRQIPATKREKFKKIAKESGREAAITEMKKILKQ